MFLFQWFGVWWNDIWFQMFKYYKQSSHKKIRRELVPGLISFWFPFWFFTQIDKKKSPQKNIRILFAKASFWLVRLGIGEVHVLWHKAKHKGTWCLWHHSRKLPQICASFFYLKGLGMMIENNFCNFFLWKDVMWCDVMIEISYKHYYCSRCIPWENLHFTVTRMAERLVSPEIQNDYDIKHIPVCLVPIQANKSMKWPCFYGWYAAWIPDPLHVRCIKPTFRKAFRSDPFVSG